MSAIQRADELGAHAAWLTTGALDPIAVFAAAAVTTRRIRLGTSVLQTLTQHPVRVAHSAAVLDQLAPGRFRLGIGTSHKPQMERLGLPFVKPLAYLREFVAVVRQALREGKIAYEGQFLQVDVASVPRANVPILLAALSPRSFELAGEVSDGAISWCCPADYLRTVALPALERGAAGRPRPPLIAHVFLGVTDDPAGLRAEAEKRVAGYFSLPFYARMLARAGVSEVGQAVDRLVIVGSADQCASRLRQFAEEAGADELLASLLVPGDATLELVGNL